MNILFKYANTKIDNINCEDKEIVKVINSINKEMGATVIMVTHDKEIVNSMKKRVITMNKGVIVSDEKEGSYIDAN